MIDVGAQLTPWGTTGSEPDNDARSIEVGRATARAKEQDMSTSSSHTSSERGASVRLITGVDDARSLVQQEIGRSGWQLITQERINEFARATGDHQWIHVDVERAKAGPFGGPIAHGYLTLSLLPVLMAEVLDFDGASMMVNYGVNKVRFPASVPVDSSVRAIITLDEVVDRGQGTADLVFGVQIECDARDRPVCVAETIVRAIWPVGD
jgi:acyl dehydratase